MTPLLIRSLLAVYCYANEPMRPLAVGSLCLSDLIEPIEGAPGHPLLQSRQFQRDLVRVCPGPVDPTVSHAWRAEHFRLTPRGKAMVQALQDLPPPELELHTTTTRVTSIQPNGETREMSVARESESVWAVPGTDFEYLEADL